MRLHRFALVFFAAVSLSSCGGDDDDTESGNRLAAVDDTASDDEAPDAAPADPAPRALVDPVSFQALLPFLPAAPSGWTGAAPEGSTTTLPDYKVTVVRGQYQGPAADNAPQASVTVEVTDGGFAETLAAPFKMMSMMSHESTTGYQKGITIAGNTAYETWDNGSRHCDINVLVADRFLVHLTSYQIEAAELRAWAEGMDLAALADLAD
jgi:hypothetical protein